MADENMPMQAAQETGSEGQSSGARSSGDSPSQNLKLNKNKNNPNRNSQDKNRNRDGGSSRAPMGWNNQPDVKGMETLKEKMESALVNGFERAQEEKVKELNKLSRTGKKITRKDYNSRNLGDLYRELGLEYPSGKPINDFQKN